MLRAMRVEFPGAIYHVMDRGDLREDSSVSFGWYLAAPDHRPGWMRVDRLLGEHGIQEDSAVGRQEFERHMEARRGWMEPDLATRRRSAPDKLAIAARLRNETTLPLKWIAARVQIDTAKGAKSVLGRSIRGQHQHKPARADAPCAQLEFQSTVLDARQRRRRRDQNVCCRRSTGSDVESILIRAKEQAVLAKRNDNVQRASAGKK